MSTLETNIQDLINSKNDIENAIINKGGVITGNGFNTITNDINNLTTLPVPEKLIYTKGQAIQPKGFYVDMFESKTWTGLTVFDGSITVINLLSMYWINLHLHGVRKHGLG